MSHGNIGIVQKIEFEIRPEWGCTTIETPKKSGYGHSVCVYVCVSVRLAVAFLANSQGRKGQPIELKL